MTDFGRKETIAILDVAGVDNFGDLTIVQVGKDVMVSWDGGAASVLLENFKARHLTASNFDFGGPAPAMALTQAGFDTPLHLE